MQELLLLRILACIYKPLILFFKDRPSPTPHPKLTCQNRVKKSLGVQRDELETLCSLSIKPCGLHIVPRHFSSLYLCGSETMGCCASAPNARKDNGQDQLTNADEEPGIASKGLSPDTADVVTASAIVSCYLKLDTMNNQYVQVLQPRQEQVSQWVLFKRSPNLKIMALRNQEAASLEQDGFHMLITRRRPNELLPTLQETLMKQMNSALWVSTKCLA